MEKLFEEFKSSNYIDVLNNYEFDDIQKSMLLSMIMNSLIILRRVDINLINQIANYINNFGKIENITKDKLYNECVDIIIDYIYDNNDNMSEEEIGKEIYDNYFTNGYIFHSFNSGLMDEISQNGLKIENKLIDTPLFREVMDIFRKRGVQVFGLYSPKKKNSIFFAGTLHNIYQYGMGSPSFFRKLIFQSDKEDSFLKRDYDKCRLSVMKTIKRYNLNLEEENKVLEFFDEYYSLFMEPDYAIAMYPFKREVSTSYQRDDIKRIFKEEVYHDYRVSNNISPSLLTFIKYSELMNIKNNKRRK